MNQPFRHKRKRSSSSDAQPLSKEKIRENHNSTRTSGATVNDEVVLPNRRTLSHPFKANFNDHFETSSEAVADIVPTVLELRTLLRPSTPEQFVIYDPYYCSGTIKSTWEEFGFGNVINENVDFYATIAEENVPGHDMLVTNPPFSEDHIPRLMNFLVEKNNGRPWAFLAPDYIATKPWYRELIAKYYRKAPCISKGVLTGASRLAPATFSLPPYLQKNTGNEAINSPAVLPVEPFYIIPKQKYDFSHPVEGVGKEHSHFKSMWYVWCGKHMSEVVRASRVALLKASPTSRAPAVVHGLEALDDSKLVGSSSQRLNPDRRAKFSGGKQ